MVDRPSGTVTFLFSDIEGSTQRLRELGPAYEDVLNQHRSLLRAAFDRHDGYEVDTQGDAFFVAFSRATDAVAAALDAQRALAGHSWPDDKQLKVRIGIHTGEAILSGDSYVGMAVHHGARIGAAGHGGQVLVSETTRRLVVEDLPAGTSLRELGEYRLKDLTHPQRLYQLVHQDLVPEFPALRTLDHVPNNLPQQLTSFVGREQEMAEISKLLEGARLLTLTGAGGSGKTRLCLQVGAEVLDDFQHGVWFVDLGPLSEPDHLLQAAASVLGVPEEPGRTLVRSLADALRAKRMLLILDNCEHLIDACADLVGALLNACPEVVILATSRQPLGLAGETTWRVPSLLIPDPGQSLELFSRYDAVRLFIDRALLVQPGFTVTDANAPAVAEICQRLDGIPLAIELAAARVKVLGPDQINERLAHRFQLLTSGARDVAPRRRTLRAAVDWSYDSLSEPERSLLSRLSVFAGGFDLDVVEQVCSGDEIAQNEILDLISQLVEKSLVQAEDRGGRFRYRLLETIREYAAEKLADPETWRNRHLDWIAALAAEAEEGNRGPDQKAWLDRLDAENDNIRAALRWSMTKGDAALVCEIGGGLRRFWFVRGHTGEGLAWMEEALASDSLPLAARARGLAAAGVMAEQQLDLADARRFYEAHLEARREVGDPFELAEGTNDLGNVALLQGDLEMAEMYTRETARIAEEAGDERRKAYSKGSLGIVFRFKGEEEKARSMLRECMTVLRTIGDARNVASLGIELAELERTSGNLIEARRVFEESLSISSDVQDRSTVVAGLVGLGNLECDEGDWARGNESFVNALKLQRDSGGRLYVAEALEGVARVSAERGEGIRAARLLGAAQMVRDLTGIAIYPVYQPQHDATVDVARTTVPAEFESAWAAGSALSWKEALAEGIGAERG